MTLADDLALAHELADAADEITLARFRDLGGVGRRDAQLLLERMDADGVTRRIGDRRVLRTASVRVLLTRLLTENAALTRREDLTGLSNTALINTRRSLGLPAMQQTTTTTDGTTTTSTQQSQPTVTNATPNLQPGEIPGVNSRGVESP